MHQDDIIVTLAAPYLAELEAGRQVDFGVLLARYPEHADALTDFFAYYFAFETPEAKPRLISQDMPFRRRVAESSPPFSF